jgi:hypothetical protein
LSFKGFAVVVVVLFCNMKFSLIFGLLYENGISILNSKFLSPTLNLTNKHFPQERVIRIILFIKSIIDNISQPFLILSTLKSLSLWEDKIRQLMPFVHIVVHTNRFTNFLVEVTEFWGQDGHLLFQILLSNPDVIQVTKFYPVLCFQVIHVCENRVEDSC